MYSEQTTTGIPHRAPKREGLTLRSGGVAHVRLFNFSSKTDYARVVAVSNAIDPDHPESAAAWQHWDQNRDPQHLFRRYLLERDGEVIGYGSYGHIEWSFHPDRYYVWVGVHPSQQRKGYGGALWDFLMKQLMERQPAEIVTFTRENRPPTLEFLRKRGFEIRLREEISRINPQTFDLAPFASKIAEVERSGIAIVTLAEVMRRDPEWKRHMYQLEFEVEKDVPSIDEVTKSDFEVYEKQTLGMPNLLPDAWFVAMEGDEYVGMSVLWRDLADDKRLSTGLTGVKRSHRRRGVATAMKASALSFARAYGATMVDTGNEENNPMYQLNLQLGFRPLPAELVLSHRPNGGPAGSHSHLTADHSIAEEN